MQLLDSIKQGRQPIHPDAQTSGPKCHPDGIAGYGNPHHGVVFVGIAPGREEVRKGRPFVGPSGQLFDAMLKAASWSRDKVYCTNTVCTWHDKPTTSELAACDTRFWDELDWLKPRIVVTLGDIATRKVLGSQFEGKTIGQMRGAVMQHRRGFKLMPTYHPAAVLRGTPALVYDIFRDLLKLPELLEHPEHFEHSFVYKVAQNKAHAQYILDHLRPGLCTLDIETGKSPYSDDVYGAAFGANDGGRMLCFSITEMDYSPVQAWVFPAWVAQGLRWPDASRDIRWGYHSGMGDVQGMRRAFGVKLPIDEDSMYGSYSLDERSGQDDAVRIHGLKTLAREYNGATFWEDVLKPYTGKKNKDGFEDVPKSVLYPYNAEDGAQTGWLIQRFNPRMEADDVMRPYREILIPASNAFSDITYRGVRVHRGKWRELAQKWVARQDLLEEEMIEYANELGFEGRLNVQSHQQLGRLIYDVLGLEKPKGASRNLPEKSTAKEVLEEMDHPFIDMLRSYRTISRMNSNYLTSTVLHLEAGALSHATEIALLHPRPLLHGTNSGRLSYHDPAIQTLPKAHRVGEEFAELRAMFIPHNPATHVFVEADFEQVEVWIAQTVSGDEQMLADLRAGDFHGRVTENVLGVKRADVSDLVWGERRTQAKKVSFGVFYQEGPEGLSNKYKGIGCTYEEAAEVIADYYARYSTFRAFVDATIRQIMDTGELQTCFGRKRRLPLVLDKRPLRQGVNFIIQSIASDCCLLSLIELHERLAEFDSYVVWTVHDSILCEISRKYYAQAVAVIKEVMGRPKHPSLPPLGVELSIGHNLADMKKEKDWAA